ncbi:hypothetical protein Tco_1005342 [Tanacetum coccineum]|uniref:Uncharacterized protein n=1 Tax=Tanacetum coccineum TaxID=301880 RepID=A0ABQ5FFG0_9ASTR
MVAGGVRVGKVAAFADNYAIPHHTTQPLPSGSQILEKSNHQKRKVQAAKDRAFGKRAATEEASQQPNKKKKCLCPLLSELTTGGDGVVLEFANRAEEDTGHNLVNVEDTTKVNYCLSEHSPHSHHSNPSEEDTHNVRDETAHTYVSGSIGKCLAILFLVFSLLLQYVLPSFVSSHGVSFSSGGSHRQAFSRRNPSGDGIGSSLWGNGDLPVPFVPAWNLTTDSILNDAESCAASILKGDLNRLTMGLSHVEIVRHNYVRQLLPIVFQWLLSIKEYKRSMSDVFNLAITAGWSEGMKASCSKEDAKAFLATAIDYDPECNTTFMSAFDSFFTKSNLYVEKLVESFRIPLGDLQNMWPEGTRPTLSGNAADV